MLSKTAPALFHNPRAWLPWVLCAAISVAFVAIVASAAAIANYRDAAKKNRHTAGPESFAGEPGSGPDRAQ